MSPGPTHERYCALPSNHIDRCMSKSMLDTMSAAAAAPIPDPTAGFDENGFKPPDGLHDYQAGNRAAFALGYLRGRQAYERPAAAAYRAGFDEGWEHASHSKLEAAHEQTHLAAIAEAGARFTENVASWTGTPEALRDAGIPR